MELSSSIHEDSRYISRSDDTKYNRGRDQSEIFATEGPEFVQDQRQDVMQPPEGRHGTWTGTFANTMHNMFCQAPCFVNTSNSMDGGSCPNNARMEAPASPVKDSDMAMCGSSFHGSPSPPVRFPSIHLEADDWDSGEDDSAFFHTASGGVPMVGGRVGTPLHSQQTMYRSPSNLSEAFSKGRSSNQNNYNGSAPQASTFATSFTNRLASFSLYRSPAWSDDADDEESDVVSIAGDDDWQDIGPSYNAPRPFSGTYQTYRGYDDTKTVIDVTQMEDMFDDFNVSGPSSGYGTGR